MLTESLAVVVHRTPCRIRLKIADRRGDVAYFAALQRVLAAHPEILKVAVNPRTASVIISCPDGFDFSSGDRFLGLALVEAPAPLAAADQALRNAAAVEGRLRAASGGQVGLAAFVLRLVVAVASGQVLLQLVEWTLELLVQGAVQPARLASAPAQLAQA